jgi:hypothetical protein
MPRQIVTTTDAPSSPLFGQAIKAGPQPVSIRMTAYVG